MIRALTGRGPIYGDALDDRIIARVDEGTPLPQGTTAPTLVPLVKEQAAWSVVCVAVMIVTPHAEGGNKLDTNEDSSSGACEYKD